MDHATILASIARSQIDAADLTLHLPSDSYEFALGLACLGAMAATAFFLVTLAAEFGRRSVKTPQSNDTTAGPDATAVVAAVDATTSKASSLRGWAHVLASFAIAAVAVPVAVGMLLHDSHTTSDAHHDRAAALKAAFPEMPMSEAEKKCIYDLAWTSSKPGAKCVVEFLTGQELTQLTFHKASNKIVATVGTSQTLYSGTQAGEGA